MKKKDFSKLALKGLTAGLLLSAPAVQAAQSVGLAQGCASASSSQGYGVQGGHSCAAGGQPTQGYYQGQPNQNYNQGQPSQGYYQGQPSQGYYQGQSNQNYNQGQSNQGYNQGQQAQSNRIPNQNNRQQNPSQLSGNCGAKGKCSGVIAIGDAPTKIDNQKDYDTSYESSYENQNQNDSMMPSGNSRNNSQGKYLAESQMTTAQKPMTEADLLKKLDAQGKATYSTLSPKGKALALSLANEDNGKKYADKNAVVKMAADKTASEKKWGN